jgi:hypothetical protein
LSTLAIDGTSPAQASNPGRWFRWADLVVLACALPVFILADLPMAGYAVVAGVWVLMRFVGVLADRRAQRSLQEGNRRAAMGTVAIASLGRVWVVALAILLVGLADRDSGLAAALLAAVVVTFFFAGLAASKLFEPEEGAS